MSFRLKSFQCYARLRELTSVITQRSAHATLRSTRTTLIPAHPVHFACLHLATNPLTRPLSKIAWHSCDHGLQTPREEIAFTARPKIHSHSQIFRYGRSIFCLPHRLKFSDILDLCLHWVSVVRGLKDSSLKQTKNSEVQTRHLKLGKISRLKNVRNQVWSVISIFFATVIWL